jgi:hypothetical protein
VVVLVKFCIQRVVTLFSISTANTNYHTKLLQPNHTIKIHKTFQKQLEIYGRFLDNSWNVFLFAWRRMGSIARVLAWPCTHIAKQAPHNRDQLWIVQGVKLSFSNSKVLCMDIYVRERCNSVSMCTNGRCLLRQITKKRSLCNRSAYHTPRALLLEPDSPSCRTHLHGIQMSSQRYLLPADPRIW